MEQEEINLGASLFRRDQEREANTMIYLVDMTRNLFGYLAIIDIMRGKTKIIISTEEVLRRAEVRARLVPQAKIFGGQISTLTGCREDFSDTN